MEMKISSKNIRVREEDEVNLKKWQTIVKQRAAILRTLCRQRDKMAQ
jgi:hypothetical protein